MYSKQNPTDAKSRSNKIVFIIHALSQPRCIKRVVSLQRAGFECVVYGYNRGNYDVNSFPEDIEVNVLGVMENGNNKNNYKVAKKHLNEIVQKNGKDCIYYTFGFLASFLISFKKVSFVYEISDILYAYPKYNKVRWLMKLLDKRVIRRAKYVVMTSGGFQQFYGLYNSKVILMPNKVTDALKDVSRQPIDRAHSALRFAFIGAIRYDAIFRFAQTVGEQFPDYEFHFYGGAPEKTLSRVHSLTSRHNNIIYHGPFKSPEDLPRIYGDIDIVVACYDTHSLNECIAEPNKLYESILFCRPIVVSSGTYLAKRVAEYGCGYEINPATVDSIVSFIQSLSLKSLNEISEHERQIAAIDVINDTSKLISALKQVS